MAKPNYGKVKPLQSQTNERRFVPIYTTAGPRGRQQPTPESFYFSALKRLKYYSAVRYLKYYSAAYA